MVQVVTANKENKTKAKKAKDNTNYENPTDCTVPSREKPSAILTSW